MNSYFKHILFGLFLLAGCTLSFSQEEESSEVSNVNILDKKNENLNLISSSITTQSTSQARTGEGATSNSVYIQQIGQGNTIQSNVDSPDAVVDLNQNGANNRIDIAVRAASIRDNITQTGDNNSTIQYISDPTAQLKLEVNQEGNATYEQYGVNSKTDNIKVNQGSSSRTVIVRSFK
ncbi:hypothetical protein [Mesonia maritima]|uniref:Curlin associated repeat-containing protein n=1 Tax=Mesonia maritima TaxID=1793873 RepID=A0ABU1K4S0_9FLAO|nr:hypothetical protein [Mesonia maritima]MDR6300604.1 hypothetical protein [Mesonia maritima]